MGVGDAADRPTARYRQSRGKIPARTTSACSPLSIALPMAG
jgi:hypothetical protein